MTAQAMTAASTRGSVRVRSRRRPTSSPCCASSSRSRRSLLIRSRGLELDDRRPLVRDHVHRQPRRLAGPPRRCTRSGAFLDPVTDKSIVIGGLAVLADRGDFPWWPVLVIAAREIGISIVPLARGPARHRAAGAAARQVQGVLPVLRGRLRAAPDHGRLGGVPARRPLPRGAAHRRVRAGDRPARLGRLPTKRDLTTTPRSASCDVKCLPSEPSCCSGRSSTPTARGSASSSPRRASTPTSTASSATTRRASSTRCAICSSRADAVLVCGGLGPTQDDLTRDAIAELMGVPLVRRMELAEQIATMFRTRLRDMPAEQPAAGRRPRRRRGDPEPARHRAGSGVSGRRRQVRLRGAGCAVRDAGDGRATR